MAETVGQTSASKYSELATNIISTKQACITDDAYSPLAGVPSSQIPGTRAQAHTSRRVGLEFLWTFQVFTRILVGP